MSKALTFARRGERRFEPDLVCDNLTCRPLIYNLEGVFDPNPPEIVLLAVIATQPATVGDRAGAN